MALLLLSGCSGGVEEAVGPPGVLVTDVVAGYAGDRAGLRPGDRITSWEAVSHQGTDQPSGPSAGTLEGPEDWRLLELDPVPLESLRLDVSQLDALERVNVGRAHFFSGETVTLGGCAAPGVRTSRSLRYDVRHPEVAELFPPREVEVLPVGR